MACDESVYTAVALLLFEASYRKYLVLSNFWFENENDVFESLFFEWKGPIFSLFFVGSICFSYLFISFWQHSTIWSNPFVKSILPYFYMFDPIGALLIGYGQYYSNLSIFLIGLVILTNFFLIHVLQRLFSKKKSYGMKAEILATFKAVIHHMANFYYVDNRDVIVLTTIWRALSMTGHTAQAFHLKEWIDEKQLYRYTWILAHARNLLLSFILFRCFTDQSVRHGFARSAIGHVGYMLSRAGPVFRLGSCYVGDKNVWQKHSDWERIGLMLSGQFIFITIEVGSLVIFSLLLMYWRVTVVSIVPHQFPY